MNATIDVHGEEKGRSCPLSSATKVPSSIVMGQMSAEVLTPGLVLHPSAVPRTALSSERLAVSCVVLRVSV